MNAAALTALTLAVSVSVAVAGVVRARDTNRDRRLLGAALIAAALGAVTGLAPWLLDGAGAAAALLGALHLLSATITGSLSFTFLRRVTQARLLRPLRPVPVTAAIATALVVMHVAAHWGPPLPIVPAGLPILLSSIWPTVAGLIAVMTLCTVGRFAPLAQRVGLATAIAGGGVLGAGAVLGAAATSVDPATDRHNELAATSAAVGVVGLVVLAVGITLPQLVSCAVALRRWLTAVRVLRRAQPLVDGLAEFAPEWLPPSWNQRSSPLHRPIEQVWGVLVFVHDASFLLQPLVGERDRVAALRHATQRYAGLIEVELSALADACALALALTRWRMGAQSVAEQNYVPRGPGRVSLAEDLRYLDALARAWTRTAILDEFVEMRAADARGDTGPTAAHWALLHSLELVRPLQLFPWSPPTWRSN